MSDRVYDKLRSIIERRGGSMRYERKGYPYGAWEISLNGKSKTIIATGKRSFPELDSLYKPNRENPETYDDYSNKLIPQAEERLLSLLQ